MSATHCSAVSADAGLGESKESESAGQWAGEGTLMPWRRGECPLKRVYPKAWRGPGQTQALGSTMPPMPGVKIYHWSPRNQVGGSHHWGRARCLPPPQVWALPHCPAAWTPPCHVSSSCQGEIQAWPLLPLPPFSCPDLYMPWSPLWKLTPMVKQKVGVHSQQGSGCLIGG